MSIDDTELAKADCALCINPADSTEYYPGFNRPPLRMCKRCRSKLLSSVPARPMPSLDQVAEAIQTAYLRMNQPHMWGACADAVLRLFESQKPKCEHKAMIPLTSEPNISSEIGAPLIASKVACRDCGATRQRGWLGPWEKAE